MQKLDLSSFIITRIYSVNTFYNNKTTPKLRYNRKTWAIIVKFEGETQYECNNKKIISNATNIVILPKCTNYSWQCTKSGSFSIIEFDANTSYNDIISIHHENTDKLMSIIRKIEDYKYRNDGLFNIYALKSVYELLYSLLSETNKTKKSDGKLKIIQPSVDYIIKNYNKKLNNQLLANISDISVSYFRRLFSEVFSVSPMQYVAKIRIDNAKEMLKTDFKNISEIAEQTGFDNVYHFSKSFKNHTGISPLKYSKSPYNK